MKWLAEFIGITTKRSASLACVFSFCFIFLLAYETVLDLSSHTNAPEGIYNTFLVTRVIGMGILGVFFTVSLWVIVSDSGKALINEKKAFPRPEFTIYRFLKILFACYGIALGVFMVMLVIGLFVGGGEFVSALFDGYVRYILIGIMIISFPFVYKRLK